MIVKQYNIKYIDNLSEEAQTSIVAPNLKHALMKLGIAKHNFISSSIDFKTNNAIPVSVQLQILTRVAAGIASGETHVQYLFSILEDFKELSAKKKFVKAEIEKGLELSQLLLLLDVHHIAVSLIANGERSGNLSESINDAKAFLRIELNTQKSTSDTLKGNLFYLVAALILIFGSPIFVVEFYAKIEGSGLRIERNLATDVLFLLNDINLILGAFIVFLIAFVVFKNQLFMSLFGKFYVVAIFKKIVQSKKSILFLSIFSPLYKSGLPTEQIIESYKSIDVISSEKLKKSALDGDSISDSVQSLDFSKTFKSSFKGFNRINNKEHKIIMLDELYTCLVEDLETHNKGASRLIEAFSDITVYSIIFILLYGFMLPQLSMGVA